MSGRSPGAAPAPPPTEARRAAVPAEVQLFDPSIMLARFSLPLLAAVAVQLDAAGLLSSQASPYVSLEYPS